MHNQIQKELELLDSFLAMGVCIHFVVTAAEGNFLALDFATMCPSRCQTLCLLYRLYMLKISYRYVTFLR